MMDFVGKRRWFFLGSGLLLLACIISLAVPPALKLSIDFTSGTTMTMLFQKPVSLEELRAAFRDLGHQDAVLQRVRKDGFLIEGLPALDAEGLTQLEAALKKRFPNPRLLSLPGEKTTLALSLEGEAAEAAVLQALQAQGHAGAAVQAGPLSLFLARTRSLPQAEKDSLEKELIARLGPETSYNVYSIAPAVALARTRYALFAVLAASVGILLYISWAFRRVGKPFRYGVCAVVALFHDALVVIGIFSILGKALGVEISPMFVTAILTVIGYSVHDTIVVFDRIRENALRNPNLPLESTVNNSILETLSRSLNTSLTVLVVLLALLLFGGVTIREFILALTIGIIVGTYSSVGIAAQLLVAWEKGDLGRLRRRLRLARA